MHPSISLHPRSLAAAVRAAFGYASRAADPGPRPAKPAATSPRSWKQLLIRKTADQTITLTLQKGGVSVAFGWDVTLTDETMRKYLAKLGSPQEPGFVFRSGRAWFIHDTAWLTLTPEQAAEMIGFLGTHYGLDLTRLALPAEPSVVHAFLQGAVAYGREMESAGGAR